MPRTLCTLLIHWFGMWLLLTDVEHVFVLQRSFIKLIERSFPIGLKDLTYIFVIFVVQMEAAKVN